MTTDGKINRDDVESDPKFALVWERVLEATRRPTEDPEFRALRDSRSTLEVVLKGHLFVEREIIRALEAELPSPEFLNLERMPFAAKVDLMAALNLLLSDTEPAFRAFNAARNRMAHSLDGEVSLDAQALLNKLPPGLRKMSAGDYEPRRYIYVLCVALIMICRVGYVLARAGSPHNRRELAENWWEEL